MRRGSRSKHRKNKTKHHKDKHKKRRHLKKDDSKNISIVDRTKCADENTLNAQNGSVEIRNLNIRETGIISVVDTKLKLDVNFVATTKTEHIDNVRFINDVNNTTNDTRCDIKDIDVSKSDIVENNRSNKLQLNDTSPIPKIPCNEDLKKEVGYLLEPIENTDNVKAVAAPEKENKCIVESRQHKDATYSVLRNTRSKNAENRKLRRKRRKLHHDTQIEGNLTQGSSEDILDETVFKHRRKKHKHTNEHKNKKHHDVRKAPQDGIIIEETQGVCSSDRAEILPPIPGKITENTDGIVSEPQRLAIKIKLCQECNSRHLQDACPLITPLYIISDTISYEEWRNKHKSNAEIMKAIKSSDPMSEGYGRYADDGFDSDDESVPTEQCKNKSKVQREEKQLVVDEDRPLYARNSLPDCFELKITNTDHGLGIYAKNPVPKYAKLGPLIGVSVKEMDIPDDFSMRHIWEVLLRDTYIDCIISYCKSKISYL